MNPQLQALLQAILGGGQSQMGQSQSQPMQSMQPAQSPVQADSGANFQQFSLGGGNDTENSALMRAIGGFSPVNLNPNYGGTVGRFFNQNPLAGAQPFTGTNPLQPGAAGNNAVRGGQAHSSFMPNSFGSSMQQWS